MLPTIAEAVTERLYGRTFARAVDAEYRAFANHNRDPRVPVVLPAQQSSDAPPADRPQLPSQDPPLSPRSQASEASWISAEYDSDEDLPGGVPVNPAAVVSAFS